MTLARVMGREEKRLRFHAIRERLDTRASCNDAWAGAYLDDTGSQSQVDGLNTDKVRWYNLLTVIDHMWGGSLRSQWYKYCGD